MYKTANNNSSSFESLCILKCKGCVSKNVSCAKYCLFKISLNTYCENKGCFQKSMTTLLLKMSLLLLRTFMKLKIFER